MKTNASKLLAILISLALVLAGQLMLAALP